MTNTCPSTSISIIVVVLIDRTTIIYRRSKTNLRFKPITYKYNLRLKDIGIVLLDR